MTLLTGVISSREIGTKPLGWQGLLYPLVAHRDRGASN
jgi:hypothetical protein